jgi:DNA-binding CsgD family transcriptional regulator
VEVSAFEDWPLPDMPFDAVVSASAFHWLDPHVRFAKSARALRPGGSLTIVHAHHVRGGTPGFFEGTQPYYMKWGLSDDPFFKPPAPADAPVMDPELDAQPGFRSVRRRRFEIPRQHTTAAVWDHEGWYTSCARQVQVVRDAGALAVLPIHLTYLAMNIVWTGDFAGAASLVAEIDSVAAVTGTRFPPYALLRLRALQGREDEASAAIAAAIEQFGGEGTTVLRAYWAAAVLYNGLARYREAALAAQRATSNALNHWIPAWVLPELVEAAVRGGDAELAREALDRLADTTRPCGTEFALGVEARCRALLSDGAVADELYREAIERLRRTQLRPELARAHLLYGEWLRRENHRSSAREQLRTAHDMLATIGMEAFAGRARQELQATGEKVRKRTVETRDDLTPQERQIARLARDGLSNPEIGARLFLSPRTVEWHLRNVFTKLGIQSRRELAKALADPGSHVIPA